MSYVRVIMELLQPMALLTDTVGLQWSLCRESPRCFFFRSLVCQFSRSRRVRTSLITSQHPGGGASLGSCSHWTAAGVNSLAQGHNADSNEGRKTSVKPSVLWLITVYWSNFHQSFITYVSQADSWVSESIKKGRWINEMLLWNTIWFYQWVCLLS